MSSLAVTIIFLLCILLILEVKFRPRIDIVEYKEYGEIKKTKKVLLYYSIKSKFSGEISREYLCLFKL